MASAPGQAKTSKGRPGSAKADGRYKLAFLVHLPPQAAFSRIRRDLYVLPPFALCITKAWQSWIHREAQHRWPCLHSVVPSSNTCLSCTSRRAGGEGVPASCASEPDAPLTGVLLVGGPPLRSLPWAGSACAWWASAARQCFSTPTTAAFSCEVLLSFDRQLRRLLLVSLVVRAALFFYVAVVKMAAFLAHRAHVAPRGAPPPSAS